MPARDSYNLKRAFKGIRLWQILAALVCFAAPLALAPLMRSQTAPRWERVTSWPGDQIVRRLAISEANGSRIIYAVGTVSGLYNSPDDGATWVRALRLPHERAGVIRVLDLAINPRNPNEVYAIVASSETRPRPMLYWSSDAGQTWQARSSLGPRRLQGISFSATGDELYIATSNEIVRAFVEEQGKRYFIRDERDLARATVGALESETEITLLVVNDDAGPYAPSLPRAEAITPRLIYAGTRQRGLKVLGDGLQIIPGDAATMDADTRAVRELATIYALCIDPHQAERVYVGTDRGLYVSNDAGLTWQSAAPALQGRPILALLADPDDTVFYAGLASGGVWASRDDGAAWEPVGDGMGRPAVLTLGLSRWGPAVLYAATDQGLWRAPLTSRQSP